MRTTEAGSPARRALAAGAVALFALAFVPGCGAKVGDVSGAVKYKGKPVTSGSVMFSVEGHPPVTAALDEQGRYTAQGVPAGTATVTVSSPDPRVQAARAGRKGAGEMTADDLKERKQKGTPDTQQPPVADATKWFPIPEQHADPTKSGLKYDVRTGPNSHDIDLP